MVRIRKIAQTLILMASLAALLSCFYGCASYEREEYYENGQLKERESASGMSVRPKN